MELTDYQKRIMILRDLSGSIYYGKPRIYKKNQYSWGNIDPSIKSLSWLDSSKTLEIYEHCKSEKLFYCDTIKLLDEYVTFLSGVSDASLDCLVAGLIWSKQYESSSMHHPLDSETFFKYYKQLSNFDLDFNNPRITKEEFASQKYDKFLSSKYQTKFANYLHNYIMEKCPDCPSEICNNLMGERYAELYNSQAMLSRIAKSIEIPKKEKITEKKLEM